ncbi:MAG: hypothetical protein ABIH21_02525 [Patescibacteria group bacterium]
MSPNADKHSGYRSFKARCQDHEGDPRVEVLRLALVNSVLFKWMLLILGPMVLMGGVIILIMPIDPDAVDTLSLAMPYVLIGFGLLFIVFYHLYHTHIVRLREILSTF